MDRDASLYDRDFYAWTQEQATVIRDAASAGANLPIDWDHVAEEIEAMGKSDLRAATSHIARIIEHLLKLEHSPACDPRPGWMQSVAYHRQDIDAILGDSPSLRRKLPEVLADGYRQGRRLAALGLARDTGFAEHVLPVDCPYRLESILDPDWWPSGRPGPAGSSPEG